MSSHCQSSKPVEGSISPLIHIRSKVQVTFHFEFRQLNIKVSKDHCMI